MAKSPSQEEPSLFVETGQSAPDKTENESVADRDTSPERTSKADASAKHEQKQATERPQSAAQGDQPAPQLVSDTPSSQWTNQGPAMDGPGNDGAIRQDFAPQPSRHPHSSPGDASIQPQSSQQGARPAPAVEISPQPIQPSADPYTDFGSTEPRLPDVDPVADPTPQQQAANTPPPDSTSPAKAASYDDEINRLLNELSDAARK